MRYDDDPPDHIATVPEAIREWAYAVADPDPSRCRCGGTGWMCSDYDTWETCPVHYRNQTHPEEVMYGGGE